MCSAGARLGGPRPHRVRRLGRTASADGAPNGAPRPPPSRALPIDCRRARYLVADGPAPELEGRDARPLRSEVPAVSDPDWVAHVIWWQVYPLGFVGAFPPSACADRRPAPAAAHHRLAGPRGRTGRLRSRPGPGVRLPHTRLRHHRPLGDSTLGWATTRTSTGSLGECRRARLCGYCWTARPSTTSAPTSLATATRMAAVRVNGSASARNGFATFEGHGELIALNHDNPDVVAYTVEVMDHLAEPWRRWLAPGRRLCAVRPVVLGEGAAAGTRPSPAKPGSSARSSTAITRPRCKPGPGLGHPVRAVEGDLEQPQRRRTSTSSTGRCSGTTSFRDDVHPAHLRRQPRRQQDRQPAGPSYPRISSTPWCALLTTGGNAEHLRRRRVGLPRRQGGTRRWR